MLLFGPPPWLTNPPCSGELVGGPDSNDHPDVPPPRSVSAMSSIAATLFFLEPFILDRSRPLVWQFLPCRPRVSLVHRTPKMSSPPLSSAACVLVRSRAGPSQPRLTANWRVSISLGTSSVRYPDSSNTPFFPYCPFFFTRVRDQKGSSGIVPSGSKTCSNANRSVRSEEHTSE